MKIRSMQTCIMSSLPRCIFRCSVFRYVTSVSFFFSFFVQTLLFNCNSFTLVANKYLLTYSHEILGQKTEKMQLLSLILSAEELISTNQSVRTYFTVFGFVNFNVTFLGNYFWENNLSQRKI